MSSVVTLSDAYFGEMKQFVPAAAPTGSNEALIRSLTEQFQGFLKRFPDDEAERAGRLPDEFLQALRSAGFFGLNIPQAYGGQGLSMRDYLSLVEIMAPLSMSVSLTVLAHLSIGVKGVVLFGNPDQCRSYLPRAASGELIFAYALTEPGTGSDAQRIETEATLSADGRHYLLNGTKTYITNANFAGAMTVFARFAPGQLGAFIVEREWEGVTVGREMPKMGLKASSTATVNFKQVRVPRENLLGQPGDGFKIAMTILNHGRLALGAASAGMMWQSLKDMDARGVRRKQFGAPINSFELVQEKMVHARVNATVSSAMTFCVADLLDQDPLANVAVESSHTKMFGTTRAWGTLYDALQVAGGSGYLSTQPYEKRMRDFRVTTIFEGTTEIHSIYPALFLMRRLSQTLKNREGGSVSGFGALVSLLFPKFQGVSKWPFSAERQACKQVRRMIRKMVLQMLWGLVRHGRKIQQHEFFLRRISLLSMYSFGLLALLEKIISDRNRSVVVREDLGVLRYFTREAYLYHRREAVWLRGTKDRLHAKVFNGIVAGRDKRV